MGKLYILILLSGNLAETIGPLPYGMDECLQRVAQRLAAINSDAAKSKVAHTNRLEMKCEYHATRPLMQRAR